MEEANETENKNQVEKKLHPIWITKELHSEYKEFCEVRGYNMKGRVEKFLRQEME